MKYLLISVLAFTVCCSWKSNVTLSNVPTGVRDAIQAQTKDATLRNITTQTANGATDYLASMTLPGGVSKDVTFDSTGKIVSIAETTPLGSIPAAARNRIEKTAQDGHVVKVQRVTQNGVTNYEATIRYGTHHSEVTVGANGVMH